MGGSQHDSLGGFLQQAALLHLVREEAFSLGFANQRSDLSVES